MSILRAALADVRHETVPAAAADYWADRFGPEHDYNAGGGTAVYRRCLRCGGHAMLGSLSAHARWCDSDIVARAHHIETKEA